MDSKGIINIELLFCTLILILLLIVNLPMIEKGLNSDIEIHENSEGRFLANHIADSINEVNSNEYGFRKKIKLPESIEGNFYKIIVTNNVARNTCKINNTYSVFGIVIRFLCLIKTYLT